MDIDCLGGVYQGFSSGIHLCLSPSKRYSGGTFFVCCYLCVTHDSGFSSLVSHLCSAAVAAWNHSSTGFSSCGLASRWNWEDRVRRFAIHGTKTNGIVKLNTTDRRNTRRQSPLERNSLSPHPLRQPMRSIKPPMPRGLRTAMRQGALVMNSHAVDVHGARLNLLGQP